MMIAILGTAFERMLCVDVVELRFERERVLKYAFVPIGHAWAVLESGFGLTPFQLI